MAWGGGDRSVRPGIALPPLKRRRDAPQGRDGRFCNCKVAGDRNRGRPSVRLGSPNRRVGPMSAARTSPMPIMTTLLTTRPAAEDGKSCRARRWIISWPSAFQVRQRPGPGCFQGQTASRAGAFPMSHGVQGPGASNITRRLGLGCLSHVVFPCRTDNFAGSQVAQDSLAHGAGVAERAAEAAAN